MVYCKTGRPEIANDVMGVHQTDVWTMLKPQEEWRPGLTRDALIEEMDKLLTENVPGVKFGFSQPIEMRVNELVAGVKSDVAVLIYGPDLDVLRQQALEVERVLARIPGAQDVKVPSAGRLPMLRINVRRDQLARYGIKASDVLEPSPRWAARRSAPSSRGRCGIRLQVRLPESWRNDAEKIGSIRIVDPQGRPIPLKDLADIALEEGPSEVERENVQRRVVRRASTSGAATSPASSPRPRRRSTPQVKLPPGYIFRWGGQFEHLETASQRLADRGAGRHAADLPAALQHVPLDPAGIPDLPGRADGGDRRRLRPDPPRPAVLDLGRASASSPSSAWPCSTAWSGSAPSSTCRQDGVEPHEAAREAAIVRLRPILMTALVAGLGFIPMALATTPGAEIQRPLATVVIGGLFTTTLLTSLVLPAIYPWFTRKHKRVEL